MSFVSPSLRKINTRHEAPLDAYLLYDLKGGIYWISLKDFPRFTIEWIGIPKPPAITVDLTSTGVHAIIFDLDYHPAEKDISHNIINIFESILKMVFIPSVPNFTYIIATRKEHKGIHIHMPEFKISHDDYILLCEHLQFRLKQSLSGHDNYTLDILMNAMLPGASKPNTLPYGPVRIVYVDEKNTHILRLVGFQEEHDLLKKKFTNNKSNAKSLFRSLLKLTNLKMLLGELKQLMMPVICSKTESPPIMIAYPTAIGKIPTQSSTWNDVSTFVNKKSKEQGFISKSTSLIFNTPNVLQVYHHLKLNACNMIEFETNNHAIKMWYERLTYVSNNDHSHIPPFFRDVHEMLQFEHQTLAQNPNPIKTIMQFNNGYYFLPVFYALCRHYHTNSVWMADQLLSLLDTQYFNLLEKIRIISPKNIHFAITDISINTLHFCANNLHREQPKTNRDKLKSIVENNRRAILSVTTHDQMLELLRNMQDRHLPIRVLKLRNALKKPSRFIWNALTESWQEVNNDGEITNHIQNLWSHLKQFYNEYKTSGGPGGPDVELINKFNVSTVIHTILSDTTMERKDIQMDTHKWFLRLKDGVLDLLTGHIGGVVPEFFLSDRKIDLGIPRSLMSEHCHSEKYQTIYEQFTDKKFFLSYLRSLFLDEEDTLYEALRGRVPHDRNDELTKSMMHFYVNLCKCTSFEYDLIMYMLDILASVFIATNYERKFFVWKGLTRNGKSKLFELMGRVLGGYYHSIQSENLTSTGHSAGNANPELASTLFSCRMVTSEELEKRLDENRVKQITGNSFVAFRNMYEQNSGGIPTAKLFATTNNYPECKASEAFKDRVVAIPFDAEFSDTAPEKTSEQVEKNTFQKEPYVVEQSYKGCFLILYYHLRKHINQDDGLLHYREAPECVIEFTYDYLIHADIYVQFKLHMDVQLKPDNLLPMMDVKSAVRQFLKTTKNTSFHETDIFISFEKEFGHLRKTDVNFQSTTFSYINVTETQPQKKTKLDDTISVYYDGVVIKNLKRPTVDD